MQDNKIPSIAEKVRFWEEQDRINQALIPRIIELHETVETLSKNIYSVDKRIASAQAQSLEIVDTKISNSIQGIDKRIASAQEQTLEIVDTKILDSARNILVEIDVLKKAQSELNRYLQTVDERAAQSIRPEITELLNEEMRGWKKAQNRSNLIVKITIILSSVSVVLAVIRLGI